MPVTGTKIHTVVYLDPELMLMTTALTAQPNHPWNVVKLYHLGPWNVYFFLEVSHMEHSSQHQG